MKQHRTGIGFLLAGLVILPGCMSVPSYRHKPLKFISDDVLLGGVEKGLTLLVKRLTENDISYLFGVRGRQISGSCEVIYLSVHNLSSLSYILSPADINCETMPYHEVIQLMKTNSVARLSTGVAAGGGVVASYYLTVLGVLTVKFGHSTLPALLIYPTFIVSCSFPILGLISAGVGLALFGKTLKSVIINTQISSDLREKTLHRKVVIKSGEHYEGLIFIRASDYQPDFAVTMHEEGKEKNGISFDVNLDKNVIP